jgi:sporulation protein YlmC with PRC-barrel domain
MAAPVFGASEHGMEGKKDQSRHGSVGAGVSERSVTPVTQLLGNDITNAQGEVLGEINNILIDTETGQIAFVTVDTEEQFTGSTHLVPFKALDVSAGEITLEMDKDRLASAPIYEEGIALDQLDRQSSEFFGVSPFWEEESDSAAPSHMEDTL